jgi:hypothetical protein
MGGTAAELSGDVERRCKTNLFLLQSSQWSLMPLAPPHAHLRCKSPRGAGVKDASFVFAS